MTPLALPLAQAAPFDPSFLLMMGLIFVVFYFFMIRPQARREKQRRAMLDAVKKGDRVVTIGGVHGTVRAVEEATVLVQVDDNVKLRIDKNAVASIGSKDAPAKPAAPVKEEGAA